MAMTLKVVVPPHPLISHWLTVLRNETTPPALYATAFEELGRWLTYEAVREWLPYRTEEVITPTGKAIGNVIEPNIPLLSLAHIPAGLQLWIGAKNVLPNSRLCINDIPHNIESNTGIIIYTGQITTGVNLLNQLKFLSKQKVQSNRIRVITALAASDGLKKLGESVPELVIYTACIDPGLTSEGQIIPGIGNPETRLNIN